MGLLALGARSLYTKVQESAHRRADASASSSTVANAGLAVAAVSIAPLLLFAFLWAALLVLLGAVGPERARGDLNRSEPTSPWSRRPSDGGFIVHGMI